MRTIFITKLIVIIILVTGFRSIKAQNIDSLAVKEFIKQAVLSYNQKEYEKCREYSLKAIEIDSACGQAYLLIGSAYVNSAKDCSTNRFEEGMVYCLAVDKFIKAKQVDDSITEQADKLIKAYSRYFPSKEDIFTWHDPLEGDKYKINCWINEETTVRFSD